MDTLTNRLQCLEAGRLLDYVNAHAFGRTVINRRKDGTAPSLSVNVAVASVPHI